jgi:hypothetical protein
MREHGSNPAHGDIDVMEAAAKSAEVFALPILAPTSPLLTLTHAWLKAGAWGYRRDGSSGKKRRGFHPTDLGSDIPFAHPYPRMAQSRRMGIWT